VRDVGPQLVVWVLIAGAVLLAVRVYLMPADQRKGIIEYTSFLLALFGVLAARWAWWKSRRAAHMSSSTAAQVDAAAERLAEQMFATWSQQVVQRGIEAPVPVRVRWTWASEQVAMSREELRASPGLSTDPLRLPGADSEPSSGEILGSGTVTRLHDEVYARLQHGRLILIGGPGAGKTGAMILLLLEALRHRRSLRDADQAEVPVPAWLTLGSWNSLEHSLREWVITTMSRDHPYLRAVDFGLN
jgi:predicted NACHT family NTPase